MTAYLSPVFQGNQVSDTNQFLMGGLIWFYEAGSSTEIAAYQDSAGLVPWDNPIVLNSRGESGGTIWLKAGTPYRIVLEGRPAVGDAHGTVITDHDDLYGINDPAQAALSSASYWVPFTSATFGYTDATHFWITGDYRSLFPDNIRVKTTNTGGTIYSSVVTAVYSTGVTTVQVVNDSGTLDSGLSAIWYGFMAPLSSPTRFTSATIQEIKADAHLSVIPPTDFTGVVTAEAGGVVWNDNNCPGSGVTAAQVFQSGVILYRGIKQITITAGTRVGTGSVTFSPAFPTNCTHVVTGFGTINAALVGYTLRVNASGISSTGITFNLEIDTTSATAPANAIVDVHYLAIGY